jgi:molybdate transport system ATP-binding protein
MALSGIDAGAPLLRATGIERHHAGRTVLSVDAFSVMDGEVVAVLGPNGAGKSTLFRILLLLEAADAGTIELRGVRASAGDVSARRSLAGVFQRPHLFAGTVRDNVAFGLRARGADPDSIAESCSAALARLGIAELAARAVGTLSGGEAQRVALARAIVCRPQLLLLDEPTANLDAHARRTFRHDMEGIVRGAASAAVLITHDPADAFALADRVVVLEGGSIVQRGTPAELLAAPATPFVAAFTGAEILLDGIVAAALDELVEVDVSGGIRLQAVAATRLAPGTRVHIAYRPEDIVLEPAAAVSATSARNRLLLRVAGITPTAGLARVRLCGPPDLIALVTRSSAGELGLAAGVEVAARVKVSALRAFAAA